MSFFLRELGGRAARSLVLLGLTCLAVVCCSRSANSLAQCYAKAFASAPPEIKAVWDSATSAAKTNGYATALLTFQALAKQPKLTAAQLEAVQETSGALRAQMYEAAKQDDPQAQAAVEQLRRAFMESRGKRRP